MKVHKQHKQWFWISFVTLGLLWLLLWPALATATVGAAPTVQSQLQAAWQRAHGVGNYRYTSNVRQTTHPTARLENAGRRDKTQQMTVEGRINRTADTMQMKFSSSRKDPRSLEVKVENGKAYGRTNPVPAQGDGEGWQAIENNTDLFAPGGDPLGFLVAAKNIRLVESTSTGAAPSLFPEEFLPKAYTDTLTRYAFDLNSTRYAEYMRDRMQDQLSRTGELLPVSTWA